MNVDVDINLDAIGPARYNGHIILYQRIGSEWKMKCADCGREVSGDWNIPRSHEQLHWLCAFTEFRESCNGRAESFSHLIEKQMEHHVGKGPNEFQRAVEQDIRRIALGNAKINTRFT